MVISGTDRPITVADYERMTATGLLARDDRVELLEGEIVPMTPVGSRHAATVDRLARSFHRAVGDHAIVRVQNPVRLGDRSEPEPDLALLRPADDFYAGAHPGAEDLYLVVEVAESSHDRDTTVKAPLYARHGVPELWIVDLAAETVAVHREPEPDGYRSVTRHGPPATLTPRALPDAEITLRDVLD